MCVTAHFINKDWKLCKKIIGFMQITSHTRVDIGETLATCLEEWGIKNIMCIATDNASANDTAIIHMRHKLKLWGSDFLDSKYLHIRCLAHVVNLVVNDGLRESSISIERVREAVKWVKSSPARLAKFKSCIVFEGIESKKLVCLNVSTRWNSTYLMLEAAEKYEAAFKLLEGNDKNFKSYLLRQKTPTPFDWNNVKRLMKYLKFFYDLTVRVSGTSYVTTHLFCKELCDVFDEIDEMEESYDSEVREMVFKIKLKVAKYWLEDDGVPNAKLNRLLYIAVILDPRRKFKYVEFILSRMYGLESGGELANEVKDGILEMFRYYKQLYFNAYNYDVLGWWKRNAMRYPILSTMARDILAAPITTIASESTFSTGGRILDSFRTSLTPKIVEAVICCRDWISDDSELVNDKEDLEEQTEFENGNILYLPFQHL
ncbi:Zinc finger BED domain-containing protein RICESLEEPER 1 [Linum perenne]